MPRNSLVLPLLLAVFLLVPGSAAAQGDGRAFCTFSAEGDGQARTGAFSASKNSLCHVYPVQSVSHAYRYGQAILMDCGTLADRKPFACPRKQDVDVKVTVIKSVKKALGLKSTTISAGKAIGPLTTAVGVEDSKATYYFMPLRATVERKMKRKKVRNLTVTVSGKATGLDGKVERFPRTRSEWSFDGSCSGRSLKIQRHLTYGGSCYRR